MSIRNKGDVFRVYGKETGCYGEVQRVRMMYGGYRGPEVGIGDKGCVHQDVWE